MSSRILKSSRSNSVDPSANGCLDEEQFHASFVDVPKLNIYSQKDVTDKLTKIKEILNNTSQDWDKRCLALKEIRSLIVQDQMKQLPDIQQQIRFLDIGLQTSLKDLRSQVVREACITVAYMAREFGGKFEYSAEPILQVLVPLMQNSAKVMATSAHTSIKFIIKAIHSPKLTTTIISNMSSKSNVIRKHCCEFIHIILNEWSRQELEKQSSPLQQAITKGLSDADSEARYFSRKAFASFSMLFPEQGYSILSSFDASKQKQLLSEFDDPNFFDSTNQFKTPVSKGRGVAPDLVASATPKAKTSRFGYTPKPSANVFKTPATPKMTTPQRGVMPKIDSGIRSSKYKVSQSTPTSRTGSPSRMTLRAADHPPPDVTPVSSRTPLYGTLRTPRSVARNGSSIRKITSQSQCNSREVSPTRRMVVKSRPLLTGAASGTLCTEGNGGNFSSMRSLPQSPCPDNIVEYGRNLEAAISDAWRQKANWFRSSDDVDAYSETSSVCSETSSYRSHTDMTEDTLGIMSRLVCGLWTERKEGLMVLQKFLRCGKRFNNTEIRKVLEIVMRMFHDSHPKVLASFFEVLGDLVQAHHQDMVDLLPSMLSRLFSKAVSDVLGNLHDKISRTLDAIRISFPCDKQLAAVCKYITEQPATVSIKAKQTILFYFLNLGSALEPSALPNTSDVRASISKILTWTSEPKNAEVRKLSQSTIVTLARNCPDQLNAILSLMPKTYQDGARKILSDQLGNNVNNNSHGTTVSGKTQKVVPRAHIPKSIFAGVEARRGTPTKNSGQLDDGVDVWDGIAKASEELQQLSLLEVEELNEGLLEDSSHSMLICNQDADAETDLGNLLESIKDSKDVTEWCGLVNCLVSFIKASNSRELWNIHFKMTYALILEAIQDAESPQRKLLGLQALREMLEKHSERFHPYAELTIMNLLETEKEKDRDVIRASDECRLILSRAFPLEQSIGILNPICLTATYPINMAAVKLLTKVFQFAPTEQIRDHVPAVAPGLVKGFEHEESGMRKSSMLCLVAIHKHIGEELMSYIKDLSQNKMKLLNVYIRKSSAEGE